MATVTRAALRDAVHAELGLPLREAAELVDEVIEAIAERLSAGEEVKISSFGSFTVRDKGLRIGPQPQDGKTGADRAAPRRGVPGVGKTEEADQGEYGRRGRRRVGRSAPAPL